MVRKFKKMQIASITFNNSINQMCKACICIMFLCQRHQQPQQDADALLIEEKLLDKLQTEPT